MGYRKRINKYPVYIARIVLAENENAPYNYTYKLIRE